MLTEPQEPQDSFNNFESGANDRMGGFMDWRGVAREGRSTLYSGFGSRIASENKRKTKKKGILDENGNLQHLCIPPDPAVGTILA